ncbi:hypothetical protein BTVI_08139 [Pitangus sulphuratus]|nr:hypothetical protein BTVI_08139 [Pitangus sulphuratus]
MAKAKTQTMPPGISTASTTSTGSGTQTTSPKIPLAPVVKKKSWISVPDTISLRPMRDQSKSDDSREEPNTDTSANSQQKQSSLKMESEVSRSITPSELRDLRKDYSHQPGEQILSWLLRCQDGGPRAHILASHEAQQLESLTKNHELDQLVTDPKPETSLWEMLVTAVKEKYPFKEYLTCPTKK